MSIRSGKIFTFPLEELKVLVAKSVSIRQILRSIGTNVFGSSYKTLYRRMDLEGIDYSHIPLGANANSHRKVLSKRELKTLLVENIVCNNSKLKKRLIKEELLKNVCDECGLSSFWNNKVLVLQLDHINGNSKDNRIENLRLLCPNCHSQTDNFSGRKNKKTFFCQCGNTKTKFSNSCRSCKNVSARKVMRPNKEDLLLELASSNYTLLGKKYGVTGNTIKKWLK